MSDSVPAPSSSSGDENTSDSPPSPPPAENSKASPPSSNSEGSSSPSPPNSKGSDAPTPSKAPPPPESSPPPSSPSESPSSGGNSSSSPPASPPPPPPKSEGSSPPPAPHPPHAPPTPSGPPPQASPPPPPHDQSGSQAKAPPPSPPPPANQSVVIIPIPITTTPPQALSPPGAVTAPPTSEGSVPSTHLPGSPPAREAKAPTRATTASPSRSSDAAPTRSGGGSTSSPSRNTDSSSSQHLSLSSSQASSSTGSVAFVGVAVAGILVAMFAIFLVIWRKKKKRMDGLVYHYGPPPSFSGKADGKYYMQSNQFGGSNPSDTFYPPRSSVGFSSGPHGTENFGGGGYHSGTPEPPGSKSSFSYEELMGITGGFSRDNLIGEGGFGCVYKGWLSDGRCVAVKQLKAGSGQGEREFQAEVEIISRVHHRHLVSLVGYCIAQSHRMLVYEFVPNGTLEHHLHAKGMPVMDWSNRLKIAVGSARGLAYLHEDCHPRIIHRDIKSANILLDYSFDAQVADFGLAKPSNDSNTHVSTRIMGTFGYLAPEYASSGKLTDRSDVFSFGVVLLELITGRKPVDQAQPLGEESLVEWARPVLVHALETGEFDELVDPRLVSNYDKGEMFRMVEAAAACVRHSAPKRPRMVQVLRALDDEGSMSDLSNGVKVGQSQVFSSGQQADMQQFRRMAFAIDECSGEYELSGEYGHRSSAYSGEQRSREAPQRAKNPRKPADDSSGEYSNDSDTRPMNRRPGERGSAYRLQSGGFS